MLTKMQANGVIRKFTAEEPESFPREWVCSVDVIGKKDALHVYVGSVVKHKTEKLYRSSNKNGVVGTFDNFNRAISSLVDSFISQVDSKSFEICATLAGNILDFKGHEIEIEDVDLEHHQVSFNFTRSGANEASSVVDMKVFAKNFILGNIKIK